MVRSWACESPSASREGPLGGPAHAPSATCPFILHLADGGAHSGPVLGVIWEASDSCRSWRGG